MSPTRFPEDGPAEAATELELSPERMRRLVQLAMDRLVAHVESLPRQPSADVTGAAALARSLREPLPEDGAEYEALLALLFDRAIPKSLPPRGSQRTQARGLAWPCSNNRLRTGLKWNPVLQNSVKVALMAY